MTRISNYSINIGNSLAANDYKLKCTFSGSITIETTNPIKIYSKSDYSITSSSHSEILADTAVDLIIQGSGFINCPSLRCITNNGLVLKATFSSATQLKCHVQKMPSHLLKVSLSFSPMRVFDNNKFVSVTIYQNAASVTTAKFIDTLDVIVFTLDADSFTNNKSCSTFLKDISKLGVLPRCVLKDPRHFLILLGRGATIAPNDVLIFQLESVRRRGITKYVTTDQSVSVAGPVKPIVPKVVIITSLVVGKCWFEFKKISSKSQIGFFVLFGYANGVASFNHAL